jgi:phosphomannomutase/phosphoglucomutase
MLKPRIKNKTKAVSNPQGIAAKGDALYKIVSMALLILMVPVALAFTYLLYAREPAVEHTVIERISQSYATQQAANVQQLFTHLGERLRRAVLSPLALSAVAKASNADVELIEQTMLDYFPEVASLRIIPIGAMGTANLEGGNHGLRNHIEVDLVRRVSMGEATQPEAYRFEGQWLTSIAYQVFHPRIKDRQAVIIATIDNALVVAELEALDNSIGKSQLQQTYITASGAEKTETVAVTGSANSEQYTRFTPIANTTWNIAFTPSHALLESLKIERSPIFAVLLVFVLASMACFAVILLRFRAALENELNKLISAADKKTPLLLAIAELVPVAKQLRRATLRSLRQNSDPNSTANSSTGPSAHTTSTELTNPMFQSTSILDDDDVLDLNLDIATSPEPTMDVSEEASGFPRHIFRAYDIRGLAKTELSDGVVSDIAGALASIAEEVGEQTFIIACDGRSSSPRIKAVLIKSLMEAGRDIIDIGLVPTPLLYFATQHLDCRSGIMITGSHNPAEYNGLKIVMNQQTIGAGGIKQIRDRISAGNFVKGAGRMMREDVVPAYIDEVVGDIAIAMPLKIVLDAGNGATSDVAPELFEELGCEVVPLYCEIDGRFPNHPPDTSNEENLNDLIEKVLEEGADFGVAFDGDGDRLAVVTSTGKVIRSDTLLMLYAQDIVSRNPGADVVFDVKCSRHLSQLITRYGGRPVLWKTGHAHMKEKMRETGALLGGEFSGHMFFGERWFGFDDGMYAAGRLAEILSTHGLSLDESVAEFAKSVNTPEILIPVSENDKFRIMNKIVNGVDFANGKINTIDGIRVDYETCWGLIRASNTSAALTARFEASSEEELEVIMQEFRAQIGLVEPDLELTF